MSPERERLLSELEAHGREHDAALAERTELAEFRALAEGDERVAVSLIPVGAGVLAIAGRARPGEIADAVSA